MPCVEAMLSSLMINDIIGKESLQVDDDY